MRFIDTALGAKTLASLKQLPPELIEALRNATADGDKKLRNRQLPVWTRSTIPTSHEICRILRIDMNMTR